MREFLLTVYVLVSERRWDDLREYFALIREILALPRAVLTAGIPVDKEV